MQSRVVIGEGANVVTHLLLKWFSMVCSLQAAGNTDTQIHDLGI